MSNIEKSTHIKDLVIQKEKPFMTLAPDMDFQKESVFALMAVKNSTYLAACDPNSIAESVLGVAMTGLTLNPIMAHGYLIPNKGKAQFRPGYQGLIYLLIKSGLVRQVEARNVCENDEFDLAYGDNPSLTHKPAKGERGELVGFYAIATDIDGNKHIEYMAMDEVFAVAKRGDMNKGAVALKDLKGPWGTDTSEMGRKTVVRRLFKYLPKNNIKKEFEDRLAKAFDADNDEDITAGTTSGSSSSSTRDLMEGIEFEVSDPIPINQVKVGPPPPAVAAAPQPTAGNATANATGNTPANASKPTANEIK